VCRLQQQTPQQQTPQQLGVHPMPLPPPAPSMQPPQVTPLPKTETKRFRKRKRKSASDRSVHTVGPGIPPSIYYRKTPKISNVAYFLVGQKSVAYFRVLLILGETILLTRFMIICKIYQHKTAHNFSWSN
jgi:hypothetical protein